MVSVCFIVEGQTEEKFVENILVKHLKQKASSDLDTNIIVLNGGINIDKLEGRIRYLLYCYDYVTTLIDLARLDSAKFENYSQIMKMEISSVEKAQRLENQLLSKVCGSIDSEFIPFLQPYEFEALCFADLGAMAKSDPELKKSVKQMEKEAKAYPNCESINSKNLPSVRLAKYGYVKQSSLFHSYANLEQIRSGCPHFNGWVKKLEEVIQVK